MIARESTPEQALTYAVFASLSETPGLNPQLLNIRTPSMPPRMLYHNEHQRSATVGLRWHWRLRIRSRLRWRLSAPSAHRSRRLPPRGGIQDHGTPMTMERLNRMTMEMEGTMGVKWPRDDDSPQFFLHADVQAVAVSLAEGDRAENQNVENTRTYQIYSSGLFKTPIKPAI